MEQNNIKYLIGRMERMDVRLKAYTQQLMLNDELIRKLKPEWYNEFDEKGLCYMDYPECPISQIDEVWNKADIAYSKMEDYDEAIKQAVKEVNYDLLETPKHFKKRDDGYDDNLNLFSQDELVELKERIFQAFESLSSVANSNLDMGDHKKLENTMMELAKLEFRMMGNLRNRPKR